MKCAPKCAKTQSNCKYMAADGSCTKAKCEVPAKCKK